MNPEHWVTLECPACLSPCTFPNKDSALRARYCPFCSAGLKPGKDSTIPLETTENILGNVKSPASVTLIKEHIPKTNKPQFTIGTYQVLHSIGKGGMGEVFLAYDTTCGRKIALKRVRPDLHEHPQLHNRFLKEARITSQLTHPAIIPIYSIQQENNLTYYTMPFVEGKTLKQILRSARNLEKKGDKSDQIGSSIPGLIRIFLSICQAIAYAHSKKVLHRDVKPENIIVGQYGQVLILDWGLAKLVTDRSSKEEVPPSLQTTRKKHKHPLHQLTRIGRVVGTVSYMAPERALGNPANYQTDIYSLGVILYQILTLKHPFQRESLKDFREKMDQEKLIDPAEVAPYRDVPRSLARVVMKCLAPIPEQRYTSVDSLIHDLENYIEGRSEWFPMAELSVQNKLDWEFQENVLIAEHVAITREAEVSEWVSLMISKASFQGNTKVEAVLKIGGKGQGLGFLLSVPESAEREHLNDGYCLWLGSDLNKSTKLLRSTVEVMHAEDIFLKREEWYNVRIEKIDNNIYFYLNDVLQFSFISHLPIAGTHVGLLSRDADYILKDFTVFSGSQNVTVNCLAVPDAFLAHKDYQIALNEYRRIGYSFPGRAEGREAMFRAGITLLEQANQMRTVEERQKLFDLAQDEFEKLHGTPGAPLEYLGKALVYQALKDHEEEIKCFELAFLRYPNHPLLPVLREQVVYRMHESSLSDRQATYTFMLLALRYLPNAMTSMDTRKLYYSLEKHWEPLFFLEMNSDLISNEQARKLFFGIKLSFWLAKPHILIEFIQDLEHEPSAHEISYCNAIFALIELGSWKAASQKLSENTHSCLAISYLKVVIAAHEESVDMAVQLFKEIHDESQNKGRERTLLHLMELSLDSNQTSNVHSLVELASHYAISPEGKLRIQCCQIWAYLLEKNWQASGDIIHKYPVEFLSQETSLLHFLYGCWLSVTEGKEIADIHLTAVLDVPFPRTWTLVSHHLKGKIHEHSTWTQKAFMWEKRQLFRELSLYYHCRGEPEKSLQFHDLVHKEQIK